MFFKAINANNEDYVPYFRTLIECIRDAGKRAQDIAGSGKTVSAQLVHTIRFGNTITSSGEVRFNSTFKQDDRVKCESCTQPLIEGENYNFGPFQEFVHEVVAQVTNQADTSLMMGYAMEKDDIVDLVVSNILNYLENRKIFDGVNISVTCSYGSIESVTVTLA